MDNRSLVRTDHVARYHLFVDTEARRFDAFRVELLDQSYLTIHGAVTLDDAWREALDVVTLMRSEYSAAPVRHPAVFEPFAIITAVEHARESTKLGLRIDMMSCNGPGPEPDASSHESRVRSLCKALDQIEFLKRQPQVLN